MVINCKSLHAIKAILAIRAILEFSFPAPSHYSQQLLRPKTENPTILIFLLHENFATSICRLFPLFDHDLK